MKRNFLKSSLQNASVNIVLQMLFRVITFLLNGFVVRRVSQEAIGIMYVRLLLMESTVLFLTREAFRKACLTKTVDHNWPQVINLLWLTVPLCTVLSILFGYIWLYLLVQPNEDLIQYYRLGVWAIGLSCIIDMLCEPLYLVAQAFLFVKFRAVADLASMLLRSVVFASIVWYCPEKAVLAFSIAQMLCVTSYTFIFYGYFTYFIRKSEKKDEETDFQRDFPFRSTRDFFPKKLQNQDQIDWNLFTLIWSFSKQGVLMQLLTEGERYVMTLLNVLSFSEQGIFDIVNNLGSLAARFIFRPIEESAYFYFSQLIHRDKAIQEQNKMSMDEAAFVLENLLRGVTSLGLLVLCFGQAYSRLFLFLYGGQNLSTGLGPQLLRTHCLAILLLAINGSTEAYALSTMNKQYLNKYNKVMIGLSTGFLLANWLLSLIFGSVGFIFANCCNMIARIIHSMIFIQKRYQKTNHNPLKGLMPNKLFLLSVTISAIVTLVSEAKLYASSPVVHFFIGAVCFSITLGSWAYSEQELIKLGFQSWKVKQS